MNRSSTSSSDAGTPDAAPATDTAATDTAGTDDAIRRRRSGVRVGLGSVRTGPGRNGVVVAAVVALAVLVAVEVVLRVLPALPPPQVWNAKEADQKAELMAGLAAEGVEVPTAYVGSSIMDAAIDPTAVARVHAAGAGFNASLEGADGRSLAAWATDVVEPTLRPDTVVIGVSPRELNDAGLNQQEFASTFFGSRGWRTAAGRRTLPDVVADVVEPRSALVQARSRLRDPAQSLRFWRSGSRESWDAPIDPTTGQLQRHLGTADYMEPDPDARLDVFNDFTAGGESAAAIEEAVRTLQARGVSVVLVAPAVVSEDLEAVLDRRHLERSHQILEAIGERTCAPVVDLRSLLGDRSLFADNVHVNAAGSEAVSAELGARLAALDASGELRPGC